MKTSESGATIEIVPCFGKVATEMLPNVPFNVSFTVGLKRTGTFVRVTILSFTAIGTVTVVSQVTVISTKAVSQPFALQIS